MAKIYSLVRLLSLYCVSTSLFLAPAAIALQSANNKTMPDTPAARMLVFFMEAFNSGDYSKVRDFHAKYEIRTDREELATDQATMMYKDMYNELGVLEVSRILNSQELEIRALTKTKKGKWVEIYCAVEPNAPHKLVGFRFELTSPPAGGTNK